MMNTLFFLFIVRLFVCYFIYHWIFIILLIGDNLTIKNHIGHWRSEWERTILFFFLVCFQTNIRRKWSNNKKRPMTKNGRTTRKRNSGNKRITFWIKYNFPNTECFISGVSCTLLFYFNSNFYFISAFFVFVSCIFWCPFWCHWRCVNVKTKDFGW